MYYINRGIQNGASYPEDFSMLEQNKEFAIEKHGADYYIQTIFEDAEEIRRRIVLFLIDQANQIPIYWKDLTAEKQQEILKTLGFSREFDAPIATVSLKIKI